MFSIIDKTNDRAISVKGIGLQISDNIKAHGIAEYLAYTYPKTRFEVVPVVELRFNTEGF